MPVVYASKGVVAFIWVLAFALLATAALVLYEMNHGPKVLDFDEVLVSRLSASQADVCGLAVPSGTCQPAI